MDLSETFNTYVVFDPELVEKYTEDKTVPRRERITDTRDIADKLRLAIYKSFPFEPAIYDVTRDFPAVGIKTTAEQAEHLKGNLSGLCLQKI